jgi:DNA-binding MarR family transcriptional regulator
MAQYNHEDAMVKSRKTDASRAAIAAELHSASIHLLRRLRRVDADAETTSARLSVLSIVVFAGPRTLSALASAEQVAPPTMSRMVKQMEEQGLVRRSPAEHDSRALRIEATPRGRRMVMRARDRRLAVLEAMMADLGARELDLLRSAARLIDALARRE